MLEKIGLTVLENVDESLTVNGDWESFYRRVVWIFTKGTFSDKIQWACVGVEKAKQGGSFGWGTAELQAMEDMKGATTPSRAPWSHNTAAGGPTGHPKWLTLIYAAY